MGSRPRASPAPWDDRGVGRATGLTPGFSDIGAEVVVTSGAIEPGEIGPPGAGGSGLSALACSVKSFIDSRSDTNPLVMTMPGLLELSGVEGLEAFPSCGLLFPRRIPSAGAGHR